MAELINTCTERESLGGGHYRQEISIKPIAYRDGSILRRISSIWGDSGISARPHMVGASKLMVSVADDGDFRVHPTREQSRYFEFGAPLIKVGGNWVRPGFANITRDGNRLKWTTDYENAYIVHAGHYIKWGILLKNNYDRWSQFVMPVGLTGLTRTGRQLFADGVPVMHLRAPVVYDYDNDEDTRQIAHQFVQQDGQWYALFTLPDLTGMSKPLIDPTLTLQPGNGQDTNTRVAQPATGQGAATTLKSDTNAYVSLIKWDVSSISGQTVDSATLSLWAATAFTRKSDVHSILVANDGWTEAAACWNTKDGSIAWAGGANGCEVSGTDFNATAMATITGVGINLEATASLTKSYVQDWVDGSNYGMAMIENTSSMAWHSSDQVVAAYDPKLVIVYTVGGGDTLFGRIFAPGFRGAFG